MDWLQFPFVLTLLVSIYSVYVIHKLDIVWRKGVYGIRVLIVFWDKIDVIVEFFALFNQILKAWVWWVHRFFALDLAVLKHVLYVLVQSIVILGLTCIFMLPIWSLINIVRSFISVLKYFLASKYWSMLALLWMRWFIIWMEISFVFRLGRYYRVIHKLAIGKINGLLVIIHLLQSLFIIFKWWSITYQKLALLELKMPLLIILDDQRVKLVLRASRFS